MKNKKIAAIGIKVRRWVTMHGLAVNVDRRSIDNFGGIVPCGLVGREVCCVNDVLEGQGRDAVTLEDFAGCLTRALERVFEVKLLEL